MSGDCDTPMEFEATGSPRELAREIEQHATGLGSVSAIVVPWESDAGTVSMAVTSVKADGWAIEHTSLGTIRLTEAGSGRTRVAVLPHVTGPGAGAGEPPHAPDRPQLAAAFDRFARQVQTRLMGAS